MNPTETPLASTGTTQDASCDAGRVKVAPTAARPVKSDSSHFYTQSGEPLYTVQKKDGSGERPFTLADARKMDPKPLPSVTTILKVLHKEALVNWLCEQTALAVLTTPRLKDESLDAFVYRCLHTERQQDQEGQIARDRGTQIHDAMEKLCNEEQIDPEIAPWVRPAFEAVMKRGVILESEKVVVGQGYAGKTDVLQEQMDGLWLWDWKSAKTLPKRESWNEHILQLAAYANAFKQKDWTNPVHTGNVYISTVECGQFYISENPPWEPDYEAFKNLLAYWQWANNYRP